MLGRETVGGAQHGQAAVDSEHAAEAERVGKAARRIATAVKIQDHPVAFGTVGGNDGSRLEIGEGDGLYGGFGCGGTRAEFTELILCGAAGVEAGMRDDGL